MSNQSATSKRVSALEDLRATRNAVDTCLYFQRDHLSDRQKFMLLEARGWIIDAEVAEIAKGKEQK